LYTANVRAADTSPAAQVQPATALDRINAHLNANPKDLQAMFIRAVMLAEQNRRDEAIKAFTEITQKYPNLPEPFNNLAVLYADQGQYDKARQALESAIKTHPSYATAHENLGDIYAKMASEAYDKALQLDTSNTRAQGKLSLIKDIFIAGSKPPMASAKVAEISKDAAKTPPAVTPIPPATVTPVKPETPAAVAKVPDAKPAVEPKTSSDDDSRNVSNAVMQWAKAWSSKDISRYLDSYASSFQVPDGLSRKAWEQSRRQRIDKPAPIHVDISNLRVRLEGMDRAKASFKQSYKAGSIAQRTNKTLSMVKNNGKWQIEQESTDRR
jgi:tetratricopeptide (TPR) repeat protein